VDPFHPGDIGCVDRRINFLHNANDGEACASGLERPTCGSTKMPRNDKFIVRRELLKIASVISEFPNHTMRLSCSASGYC
jgi:hypothetical protein